MTGRRHDHVFEATEDVRTDDVALVAAGERGDLRLAFSRDAQMIRPERDQPLDERPFGRHALLERGVHFKVAQLDETLPRDAPVLIIAWPGHAQVAKRVANLARRRSLRGAQRGWTAIELRLQPAACVRDLSALVLACTE